MADFNKIKLIFEQKKNKGYEIGLTYNDYISIRKMINQIEKMDKRNPEINSLLDDLYNVYRILLHNGGTKKFSDDNREYIKKNSLILPLVLTDFDRINVDIVKDQPILECSTPGKKSSTVRELSNIYLAKRVNHDRIETLYPNDKTEELNAMDYVEQKFNLKPNDSLELLCRIFKYQLPEQKSKFHSNNVLDLAKRYDKGIKNPELMDILDYERELLEDYGYTNVEGIDLDELYSSRKEMISRVRDGEYDPNFIYEEPKRVFLFKK